MIHIRNLTNGWSTLGLIAIFDDGREPLRAEQPLGLVELLNQAGVRADEINVDSDGDGALSASRRSELMALMDQLG